MPAKRKAAPKIMERRKPETLRLRHVSPSLTVRDLPTSVAWYRDILGFVEERTWEQNGKVVGVSLKAGTVTIALNQDDWSQGRDRVKGQGVRMYMDTKQDVDSIAWAVKTRGGTLASEPADLPWGGRAFSVVDPDGYKLTITSIA